MVGFFRDGVGEFYANDTLNAQPITVRFRWTDTQTASPRWDKAFSLDTGATWETNWSMQFHRQS